MAEKQRQITENTINQLAESILVDAKKQGATAAEVDVHIATGYTATARLGDAETLEYHRDNNITITVYNGQKSGSVTTSDTRPESMVTAVKAACNIAKYTEDDPAAGLAEADLLAKEVPVIPLYFPRNLSAHDAMELAKSADQRGLDFDKRVVNSEGTSVSNHEYLTAYANSHGFNHHVQSTSHSICSILVAKDKMAMQRDYEYYTARCAGDLPSLDIIAEKAAKKSLSRLNPQTISTGKFPILFSAETAKSIIGHFTGAISGSALYNKSSFLLDHLGKKIFPDWLDLAEKPHTPKAMGSSPIDGNGLLTTEKHFVKDGVLENYILSVYSGRRLNRPSTANAGGVFNLELAPGSASFNDLLEELGTGLFVTEVSGPGVNIVTGDYSRGISGFWVEEGEIQYPVDEVTIAGNLPSMFQSIRCVGNDSDRRGKIITPSLIIDNMMVGGK